jgi:Fe-S-cluster containining protein
VACCKRQPGPLAPGDIERIAAHLQVPIATALDRFWASPGALVRHTYDDGREVIMRIGTITPRYAAGRCVFLNAQDRCDIHAVAPAGCAYFDTHMSSREAQGRAVWFLQQVESDERYQTTRSLLPKATHWAPTGY